MQVVFNFIINNVRSEGNTGMQSAFLGNGIVIIKYTGSCGKNRTNDANAEFVSKVISLLTESILNGG